jgi:hypothetical protein
MSVTAFEGPAGAGKTHRLMDELCTALRERPLVAHERVLAVTFMHGSRRRLDARLGAIEVLAGRYEAVTLDSFAWRSRQVLYDGQGVGHGRCPLGTHWFRPAHPQGESFAGRGRHVPRQPRVLRATCRLGESAHDAQRFEDCRRPPERSSHQRRRKGEPRPSQCLRTHPVDPWETLRPPSRSPRWQLAARAPRLAHASALPPIDCR